MKRKVTQRGNGLRKYSIEPLETRVLLASDWMNPIDPVDVDGSGDDASPVDALLVINELSTASVSDPVTGRLPEIANAPPPFLDVDGDNFVSPLDALLVINSLPESPVTTDTGSVDFAPGDSVIVGMPASHIEGISHDTLINSNTSAKQTDAAVASTINGNSVVVWSSRQDGSGFGIYGQMYNNAGVSVGDEFLINQVTDRSQKRPSVGMWSDGSFIVSWDSADGDGSGFGIKARMFNADGSAMTNEFQVNETTRGGQTKPVVAVSDGAGESGGTAYIAWEGRGTGDNNGVFWTSVDAGSTSTSGERRANSTTKGVQHNAAIDVSDDGLVAIAWDGRGVGDKRGVFMDIFSSGGNSVAGETRVNGETDRVQQTPSVSFAPRGTLAGDQLIVAWNSREGEPGAGVRARQFDVNPVADSGGLFSVDAGDMIRVNETTRGPQKRPTAVYLDDTTFLVSWFGNGAGDVRGIFSRQFAADGTPLSGESLVNATTKAGQRAPMVSAAAAGYIIAWEGRGPSDNQGVFARFVDTEGDVAVQNPPIFTSTIVSPTVEAGQTLTATATATDADGDTLVYSATQVGGAALPSWISLNGATGQFTFAPQASDVGSVDVVVTATDPTGLTDTTQFTVTATMANVETGFDFAVPAQTATVGTLFSIDLDDFVTMNGMATPGTISYAVTTGPSFLSIDAATGVLSGTPASADVGTQTVTLTATGANTGTETDAFTFVINEVPAAPQLFSQRFRVSPAAANGTAVGTVVGSDPNAGDTLTYTITAGNAAGAFAIDANSGAITVADTTALVDDMATVLTVQATDSGGLMGSGDVTIQVDSTPPTAGYSLGAFDLQGNAITSVAPGQAFELVIFTTDLRSGLPDGDGGVFTAYTDVVFDSSLVSVDGAIRINESVYMAALSGSTSLPGLLDEVGGVDGISPFGTMATELARVQMRAGSNTGLAQFTTDPADGGVQRPTLVFGGTAPIELSLIDYGSFSLTIGSAMPASSNAIMGGRAGLTANLNRSDSDSVIVGETLPFEAGVAAVAADAQFATETTDSADSPLATRSIADPDSEDETSAADMIFANLGSDL